MSNCRLKYATDIADKIKEFGNLDKTSAKKLQENQYLLPIGGFNGENTKLETVKNTYEWGKKIQTWANNRYKNVGNMVDLRNTEDGTILTIQIPKILIDAYENKFGQMTDEDFQAAIDAEEYYNEQNISNISRGAKDPNIKAKYFKDSNVTTATTILNDIAKSGHSLNKLASKLIDFAKANNVKITLVKEIAKKEGDIVNSSAAAYNASTNTIEIREDASFIGYGSEPTIIHEILHALTYKQLRDNNTTSKEFNKLYEHAKQFFPEWNKETQKGEYAIANSDEFLVALFTDAAFIKKLKTIPSTSKVGEYTNFFQEIYDYILSLFNINSSDNKNLKDSLYGQAFAVASNILVDFKERNQTNEFFQLNPNKVNASLKAIDILQSDKAKQVFEKGQKNNWPLDKILTELLIPKEQKQLLLELGITNREQLALELASNYSYTVEINTAKKQEISDKKTDGFVINNKYYRHGFDSNGTQFYEVANILDTDNFQMWEPDTFDEHIEISKKEYLKAREQTGENSSYYSNLTVPGGTNYTENEISTPLITPSIKGHAQFSTDNGIGWFRSDEQVKGGNTKVEVKDMTSYLYGDDSQAFLQTKDGNITKTRRILEVQSDLFQKGRDRNDLTILNFKNGDSFISDKGEKIEIYDVSNGMYFIINTVTNKEQTISRTELKNILEKRGILDTKKDNQFLQLLNKDNNWVTFFVKSIIQDSAKKGYEKVLFPLGDTASKVEGHSTIEEEIKRIDYDIEANASVIEQTEDSIKDIEEDIKQANISKNISVIDVIKEYGKPTRVKLSDGSISIADLVVRKGLPTLINIKVGNEIITIQKSNYSDLKGIIVKAKEISLYTPERLNQEKEFLKKLLIEEKELESKKANLKSQGIAKLKPIYDFYENKVTNILKKQGYNPTVITDEYGNTWNEITVEAKHLDTILFQNQVVKNTVSKNNLITSNDKVVFGHPTIGKSYLKRQGENKFISLDDDYAAEINKAVESIATKYKVTTYQVKDGGTQKWNNEYNQMMQELFDIAKKKAISEGKTLFTSNTNLLINNAESFDKVINLTDEEFEKRIQERGAKYDTKQWKAQINEAISKIPSSKVITTDKYLSELFQNQVVKNTVSKKNELTETIFKGLEEYIKQNGIKVEFLDSLKAKYPNDPVAVYNHIRNTIEINRGEQTADTLAEELGHHLTLALGADHVLVKRALNLIGRIDYKSELGQAYVDAYKGDVNLLKMEYLGKLIAKTIVNGYENPLGITENEIKIWDTIIAMLNKFISLFNPNSNITSELDKVAFELSSMITSGTKLDVQKAPIDNIMLFQLNAENTKESKKVSEDLRQEVFYKREIGRLKNEINSMIKKGLNTDSKEAELKKIKDGIAELEATKNKQILINLSTDTLNTIEEFINNLSDPSKKHEALNGDRIENILTTLHIFEDFIPTAERSMRLLKDLKPHIKQYVLEHVNKYSGREVTMEDLEKRDTDLFVGEKGFGTLADVKNYIGKTIGYLIKDAQGKIERANKVSFNELEKEIEAIEKYASTAGIPKKDIYKIFIQEYKDRKGKLTTILAKEYTSAFYTAISDTFKLPTAEEGKAARQALGTWNKEKEKWEPRSSAYINKDYIKIQNTPALKRYYDYYKKSIAALSEELPVNLNENFIPNLVEKSLMDIIKSDKSVGGKLKEGVMSILDIYDVEHEENAFISEEDLLLDTVPLKYIGGISPELKSSDLSSSLLKFMYFTNSYKEMSEILPKTRLLQEQIKESSFIKNTDKSRSIKGEDTNLNSMVESFINMQIKGEMKKDEKLGDFNYSKYIDFGLKYTSLLRIGLNPFNAITNILVGNIGNIIESVGGRHFSYANYVKAREIFFKELGGDSKTNKLIEIYNPLMELEDYENLNKINIGSNEYKEKTKALMYAPQRLGEKYLQTSTMIASLLHDKVTTKDGKSISMWEAFDDNGIWKEELMGYPLTENMIFKTTNKVQRINQMIHGRYSAKDAAALSQYSLFRMAFQFKKWIPAAIESRVQGRRFDDRLGVDTEGRYHTYMKFIQLNIAKLQGNKEKIESLKFDDTDIYNMRKNMMELVVILSSTLMYIGLGWDDDDKKKGWYKFTMNQLDKVSGDMMFFYNPAEMNRNVGNTLPMIKSTGDLIKALKATQYLLGGKNSEYTKGKHANENKAIAAYLDVTPIAKPIADVIRNFNGQKYQAPTGR